MIAFRAVQPLVQGVPLYPPVDLDLRPGEIVCIVGSSGVGKTSLLEAVRGNVPYLGELLRPNRIFSVYQSDDQLLPWYTVARNFELAGCRHWEHWCEKWNLMHLIDRRPGELSSGQRQRFVLVRALAQQADLLLCDEPLNNLDSLGSKSIALDFKSAMQGRVSAAIWITHDLLEAAIVCDRCFVLTKTGLIAVAPSDINFEHVQQFLA